MKTAYALWRRPTERERYEVVGQYPSRDAAAAATPIPDLASWKVSGEPDNRHVDSPPESWLIVLDRVAENADDRAELALDLAFAYGTIDGDHHKMWVIDQMVRALAGDRYDALIAQFRDGEDGPDTYEWDEGVAP